MYCFMMKKSRIPCADYGNRGRPSDAIAQETGFDAGETGFAAAIAVVRARKRAGADPATGWNSQQPAPAGSRISSGWIRKYKAFWDLMGKSCGVVVQYLRNGGSRIWRSKVRSSPAAEVAAHLTALKSVDVLHLRKRCFGEGSKMDVINKGRKNGE